MEIRKSEVGSRKSERCPKLAARQAFELADGLRKPPLQGQGKDGDKKRPATAEPKTRKGEQRKARTAKGKSKTRWRGKPEEKSSASESGRYATQEPTHKDSVGDPAKRKSAHEPT
jgi:hypothetical protein